ncbi:ABC transporter permease subunit [Bremerella cremea]|uniref:ABC transporter permease subunit n=2 Tax=Bremerella cremea TaxID=1031537 RepID=A0A368KW41_9BACT|nr:ABC transporter permease subunit [Bremerella cremea]
MAKLGPTLVAAVNLDRAVSEDRIQIRLAEITALLEDVPAAARQSVHNYVEVRFQVDHKISTLQERISQIEQRNNRYRMFAETAQGAEAELKLGEIVRAFPANQLDWSGRLKIYLARWGEFLLDDPREANSEGGVFPAIWGTVAMTMIMSLIVVPFGVLAALYLREYAKSGPIVSIIRISINNLAGVPSIVFGVFGYGFLILVVGAYIDGGPANANLPTMPSTWWWLTATGLAVVAFLAFMTTSYSLGSRKVLTKQRTPHLGMISLVLWIVATGAFFALIAFTPDFHGFYRTGLPNPTFGKGCLLWASLTLALLTLPVVIVATEEALSAVPNSLREGSYGCGASKWQTIRRIVLPHALPGIMTGMILAMARGAGEVAPLMLVGVLKLAPELPIDLHAPFVHLDRSFMHLGFHIFDLGFQSPNSEAAKPMVFTTTLLLITVIGTLNFFAIWLRARLRKRFHSGQF